jgi:hypothetical protein
MTQTEAVVTYKAEHGDRHIVSKRSMQPGPAIPYNKHVGGDSIMRSGLNATNCSWMISQQISEPILTTKGPDLVQQSDRKQAIS